MHTYMHSYIHRKYTCTPYTGLSVSMHVVYCIDLVWFVVVHPKKFSNRIKDK